MTERSSNEILQQRVKGFEKEVLELKQATEKAQHLNAVLLATQNINQTIVGEKNRDVMLQCVCEKLIVTRGYYNAWIALTDESGKLITVAEKGLGENFDPIRQRMEYGDLIGCGCRALEQESVVITEDPFSFCTDCPISEKYQGRGGMSVRLECKGKVYGFLTTSVPRDFALDDQEQNFLKNAAGKIALVLHNFELEESCKEAEKKITKYRDEFEKLLAEKDELKRVEPQVRQADKDWEMAFNAINDMVTIQDTQMRITRVNRATELQFKADSEELIGKYCYQLFRNETKPCKDCLSQKLVQDQLPYTVEVENSLFGKTFQVSSFPIFDDSGKFSGIIHTAKDISDQKKLEAQLLHAQKMESIGTLAGGIAHDFNNLIQVISGFTEILLMKKDRGDPDYNRLKQIDQTAQQASGLTKRILIFSRHMENKLQPVALNRQVEQMSKLLERTIPKMISLEFRLAKDLKIINADLVQIGQILMNLGINARDALPEGGKLLFETENVTLDEQYCQTHPGAVPGEYVLLSVADTGCGMDQDVLEHIFEPFYTTKKTGKGTGLGLAMVYGIVKSHGGYITCDSEPGQGTTFKVYFPVFMTESPVPKRIVRKKEELSGGRETILLVDDAPLVLETAEAMLESYGYKTILAESGEGAIEIFGQQKDLIDLVILDVGMPGMGGHKCLERLLELDPKVKVIIASGYALNGKVKETLESGAAGYIRKPYRLADILGKVKEVVDKK